jgi:hypothetical protein
MRKNITNFIATIGIAVILSQFLPWWSVMVASFITALFFSLKKTAVFLVPFLAIMVFWVVYSFWLSSANDFILANKIAVLLPLNGNSYLLIFVTGIIGGIAAGFSAVFGKQCLLLITKKK